MGWVLMTERDVRRIEVLAEVFSARRTVRSAAVVLAITVRQVNRLPVICDDSSTYPCETLCVVSQEVRRSEPVSNSGK